MIYFDNAATTFPKPPCVQRAALNAIRIYGGNPGRSGHRISMQTAEKIYAVRELAASFFDAQPENVIFTLNCTMALNIAIKGVLADGGHVITSSLEHNSVIRPIHAMSQKGIVTYSIAPVNELDPQATVQAFRNLIRSDTRAIVCTAASNLTGTILPLHELATLCHEYGLLFIVDAAQAAGVIPLSMKEIGIDILCTAGHKGLYGTTGTGLLILRDGILPATILEGGTGSASLELDQPDFLPDRLESGTVNTVGILSLGAGMRFVEKLTLPEIYQYEMNLCGWVWKELHAMSHVTLLTQSFHMQEKVPIISFNIDGEDSAVVAQYLSQKGFALRGGFHCAGLAHRQLGTTGQGAVRFSPSHFNTEQQTALFLTEIKKIQKNGLRKG
ncbi:MAG: aminotransferase class V-fold PLP-dependent enzyme [Candidatus Merdivicinus sp.]|jgi:cysteine desulfurase family protein